MLNIEEFKNGSMYQALLELDETMASKNMPKCELNVVGGFALMTHKIRKETDVTDIDFVGTSLSPNMKALSDEIGIKYNFGKDWINNDLMLTGTSFEDFEFSTGKLHFIPAFDLQCITVNILDMKDLLRMKIISIDTSTTAVELGGDFSRMKDFPDIIDLMEKLELSYDDIETDPALFGSDDITQPSLIGDHTIEYIKTYAKKQERGVKQLLLKHSRKNIEDAIVYTNDVVDTKQSSGSSILDSFLNDAMRRYENEKKNVDMKMKRQNNIDRLYDMAEQYRSKNDNDRSIVD